MNQTSKSPTLELILKMRGCLTNMEKILEEMKDLEKEQLRIHREIRRLL